MGSRIADRGRLTLPLVVPTLGGLAYLIAFGARTSLLVVNAAALVLGALWVIWGRIPSRPEVRCGLAALALPSLFLPPLLNLDAGGVARWLPLGPFLLHAGMLLLPVILVIAAGMPRAGPWLLAVAALALGLQPDAGTLAGLSAASAVLGVMQRSPLHALVAGGSLALTLTTWRAGTLEAQVFTEGVLMQVWQSAPAAAVALGALLFVALPVLLLRAPPLARAQALALAALLAGWSIAALFAPFPYPLIGYGAAPILGMALALGMAAPDPQKAPLCAAAVIG